MSAEKDRKGELRGLLLEMQADLEAIQKLKRTLQEIQKEEKPGRAPSTAGQLGMALCLHHLYTAIFELTKLMTSQSWHRELLRNMSLNVEGVRPVVISNELLSNIDEYRSFRHVIRRAYDYELDWSRLQPLTQNIFDAIRLFETEMSKFKAFVLENIRHLEQNE